MESAAPAPASRVPGLVSVIVPVHNRPQLLVEAVESALGQTYTALEVLIVDDASTDDTRQAIAGLIERGRPYVRVLRHSTNQGPGLSRETGRRAARGEYLQYLDSDDLLLPRKLELQIEALKSRPEAGISYGWTRQRLENGETSKRPLKLSGECIDSVFPSFLAGRIWNTVTPLYQASVCDALGPWSDLWLEKDWEFDCRAGALGVRLAFVDDWLCEYRIHSAPRLGPGPALEPRRLKEQARAHELIFRHAVRSGVGADVPEMAHFARALFLMARRCGAAGLTEEAKLLFDLARKSSTPERVLGWDFRMIGSLAGLFGWKATGRLALRVDDLRGRRQRRRQGASLPAQ